MRDPVALEALLETSAHRMDFFQVLRLLENAHPERPRIGTSLRPRDDAVRFGQDPSLSFHANSLERYKRASGNSQARLAVNFIGLTGANGALPIHLTEYVRDRARNAGDPTLMAFLDVFHHRMVSLFYRARATAEPAISFDRAQSDRFSNYIGSMFGIGSPALRERDAVTDFAKLHFAGLLASKARPASGLVSVLSEYFKVPVEMEQFVGHWMRLPPDSQSRMSRHEDGNRLGISTVLGSKVWDSQTKFRLSIGPLGYDDYQRMLPGGESMQRLKAWVRNYVGDAFDWDVRLILKKEEVPPLKMGGSTRVGYSTWLTSTKPTSDKNQLVAKPGAGKG